MALQDSDIALLSKPPVEVVQPELVAATATAADYVRLTRAMLTEEENAGFTDAELEQVCRRAARSTRPTNLELVRRAAASAKRIMERRGRGALDAHDPRHPKAKPDTDPNFGSQTPHERP